MTFLVQFFVFCCDRSHVICDEGLSVEAHCSRSSSIEDRSIVVPFAKRSL